MYFIIAFFIILILLFCFSRYKERFTQKRNFDFYLMEIDKLLKPTSLSKDINLGKYSQLLKL